MTKRRKTLLIVLSTVGAVATASSMLYGRYLLDVFSLGHALSSVCERRIKMEARSPEGLYVATVYEENCGATSDFVTAVTLRKAGEQFKANKDLDVLALKGRYAPGELTLQWKGERRLEVNYATTDRVFTKRKHWKDLEIVFQEIGQAAP